MPDNRLNLVILVANMVKEIRFCKFKRLVVWTKGKFGTGEGLLGYGVHLHSEALGTGNGLLRYGVHLQSTAQERASSFLAFVVFGAGNALLFLAV